MMQKCKLHNTKCIIFTDLQRMHDANKVGMVLKTVSSWLFQRFFYISMGGSEIGTVADSTHDRESTEMT